MSSKMEATASSSLSAWTWITTAKLMKSFHAGLASEDSGGLVRKP